MVSFTTEKRAFEILGGERFLSAGRIISAWNKIIEQRRTNHDIKFLEKPQEKPKVRFSKDVIKQTIGRDGFWYMVYDPGLSLRDIRVILGSNRRHQPRQYRGNDWWFFSGNSWTERREKPDYHFVKLETILSSMSWKTQEEEISRNGKLFCRVPSRLMISIQISYFLLYGSYIAGHCYHWGPELSSNSKVGCGCGCVSNVGPNGFTLYNWPCNLPDEEVGVFIAQKFK